MEPMPLRFWQLDGAVTADRVATLMEERCSVCRWGPAGRLRIDVSEGWAGQWLWRKAAHLPFSWMFSCGFFGFSLVVQRRQGDNPPTHPPWLGAAAGPCHAKLSQATPRSLSMYKVNRSFLRRMWQEPEREGESEDRNEMDDTCRDPWSHLLSFSPQPWKTEIWAVSHRKRASLDGLIFSYFEYNWYN